MTVKNQRELIIRDNGFGLGEMVWDTLRHTFASWSVMSGVSPKTLKEFIDPQYESQSNKYAYLAALHLQSAMDLLEAVLTPISTEA